MLNPIKDRQGIALLITLVVVTVLIGGLLALNAKARSAIASTSAIRDRYTLSQMAASGIHMAMAMLIEDKNDTEIDSVQEDWANPDRIEEALSVMEFEHGEIHVDIKDELGRIQVNALVGFPGGFGTMDEVFELLTLLQTKKIQKHVPVVLFDKTFWNEIINFKTLQEYGVIKPADLKLFKIIDSVDEAFKYITGQLKKMYL